ncbi:MAG: diacylglycerol kinase family protein [Leptospiraceae bacterium]|nr:diacylglycerol kinase family protein [Leptospiraceae bacterium]MBK9500223.1 diacylglycerol kinase family protein [Leptospiraceae bacterium]MBP9162833.1 diacylglycerol kinase family protein [Leptospiraceae bacterium]
MKQEKFSIIKRLKSFIFALNGLKILILEEHNARIHLVAALCVIIAGIVLRIANVEWIAIIFAIGFVFALETINSAIENLADFISPEKNDQIKKIKDLSAAAVLISAITAIFIGLIVFIPKLITLPFFQ